MVPFSPLHAFGFLSADGDQTQAMKYCFALLRSCDELWVVHEDLQSSEGCLMEIGFARDHDHGISIKWVK